VALISPGDAFYQYIHPDGELIRAWLMQDRADRRPKETVFSLG